MSLASFRFASRVGLGLFALGLLATYGLCWYELVYSEQVGEGVGGVLAAIPRSFWYWAVWILPFWWVSVVFAASGGTVLAVALRAVVLWIRRRAARPGLRNGER